jgi:hypothetical protein
MCYVLWWWSGIREPGGADMFVLVLCSIMSLVGSTSVVQRLGIQYLKAPKSFQLVGTSDLFACRLRHHSNPKIAIDTPICSSS